jgi:hypothetical protein
MEVADQHNAWTALSPGKKHGAHTIEDLVDGLEKRKISCCWDSNPWIIQPVVYLLYYANLPTDSNR